VLLGRETIHRDGKCIGYLMKSAVRRAGWASCRGKNAAARRKLFYGMNSCRVDGLR